SLDLMQLVAHRVWLKQDEPFDTCPKELQNEDSGSCQIIPLAAPIPNGEQTEQREAQANVVSGGLKHLYDQRTKSLTGELNRVQWALSRAQVTPMQPGGSNATYQLFWPGWYTRLKPTSEGGLPKILKSMEGLENLNMVS